MAKPERWEYTVAGQLFPFPIDMLRYDASWPASERDSALVTAGEEEWTAAPVRIALGDRERRHTVR